MTWPYYSTRDTQFPTGFCAVSVWSAISKSPIFAITIFLVSIRPSLGNQIGASNFRVTVDIDGSYCFNKAPSRASEISLSNKAPLTHIYCPPPHHHHPPPPKKKKQKKNQETKNKNRNVFIPTLN